MDGMGLYISYLHDMNIVDKISSGLGKYGCTCYRMGSHTRVILIFLGIDRNLHISLVAESFDEPMRRLERPGGKKK